VHACFDTTILIDHLRGIAGASRAIATYDERFISIVTVIEVMAGADTADEIETATQILHLFQVAQLEQPVADIAIAIRRERRLKLPDAVILATARHLGCSLVTRNTKDFRIGDPGIIVPYTV
jgi:predicted nucleic acid-binding protein